MFEEFEIPSNSEIKEEEVKKKSGDRIPATHYVSPEHVVIRSGLGAIKYPSIVGAKADYLNSLSLKLKIKSKNFENDIGKYLFDLALIKLFDISNVFIYLSSRFVVQIKFCYACT